jgi:hypothetical protein
MAMGLGNGELNALRGFYERNEKWLQERMKKIEHNQRAME